MKKKFTLIFVIWAFLILQPIGAQTWTSTKRLVWNLGDSENASIAVDSSNHIHVVWLDDTPGNCEVYYKRSTNGGASWSGTKRLTWNSGSSVYPVITVDSSNNIHLVWYDYTPGDSEIFYKRSTNGGVNWSSIKRLTWNAGGSLYPTIAVDSSKNVHVVWHDYTAGNVEIFYKRSTDAGVTWGAIKRLTWNSGESFAPRIAIDSSNNIHVVWFDFTPGNAEIFYKRSTDVGKTWSSVKRLTWTSAESRDSAVAVDPSNNIHVVWYDGTSGNYEIYHKRSTNGGVNWSGTKRLTWKSGGSFSPAIAMDSNNNGHVVWYDFSPGNYEIYYKKSTDVGVTWSGVKRLTWTSGESRYTAVSLDSSNNIHVVWSDRTSGNWEIFYRKGIQ
jgi:hypothetical protein